MNNPVMQRQMFMATGTSSKKGEQGILSGMDDVQEGYEDRTPDNIEILSNNLRGDIRSLDERYLELASMVGEAAFDTPEEVLALMQVQLQQQTAAQGMPPGGPQGAPQQESPTAPPAPSAQPGGIEALINSAAPPQQPPQGMPQGMPPEGMPMEGGPPGGIEALVAPPTEQAPVMRQAGSPPMGEISTGRTISLPPSAYPNYSQAAASYGRMAPTLPPRGGVYTQSILEMLNNAVRTEAPKTKSGNPIPFFDSRGRMYQDVGGRDPRMASRGVPFGPASSYGSQLRRVPGPAGYALGLGLLGTEALMSTDKMAGGDLPADSLGMEYGASVADTPGYRYLPGLEPTEAPPPVDQAPSGRVGNIPVEPLPSRESDAADAVALAPGVTPPPIPEEEGAEETGVAGGVGTGKPPAPKERGLKERATERYGIYKDLLGDDKNMRQAQALFLLAEAALNVAGAKSKEKGVQGLMERVSSGLKGLPAGMAALGAEASREDRAIKTAAISAAEAEMAAEAKEAGLLQRESLKLIGKQAPINDLFESFKARFGGQTDEKGQPLYSDATLLRMARDFKSGIIKENADTSELYDVASGKVLLSNVKPNDERRIGYLDPNMAFTVTSDKTLTPATNKQRAEILEQIANNEALITDIQNLYGALEDKNFIGIMPTVRSGLTNLTLPFFGENPFSDVPLQQQRNAALQMNQRLREMAMEYRGRPSNWSEQQINEFLEPVKGVDAILKDKSQFFAVLENFRQGAINRNARDYHRLFPDQVPYRQLAKLPLGAKKDPIGYEEAFGRGPDHKKGPMEGYLKTLFDTSPNSQVWVSLPDGSIELITKKNFAAMTQQTGQK
jgi:hypothetical protein